MTPNVRDFLGFDVSRETSDRLRALVDLVTRWNSTVNLVSNRSLADIWSRHILDSAQLWPLIAAPPALWRDLGSGGGFPGLVIATIAAGRSPSTQVELVESDQRKAAFLATAARTLGLNVSVCTDRIERLALQPAPVLSARALAPLGALIEHAKRLRTADGIALFPKGESVHKEIAEAERRWSFVYRLHPSRTDPRSAIVEIGAIDGPR